MGKEDQTGLHEINRYHDPAFPVGIYVVTRQGIEPEGRGYRDLHWHEELQFTWAAEGTVRMKVNAREYEIRRGEAIFINRNQLHVTTELTEEGRYISLNFPEKLLGFFAGSRMEQKDVLPFTVNSMLEAVPLRKETGWQREVLEILTGILGLMMREGERDEYRIALELARMWRRMTVPLREELRTPTRTYVRKQRRIQTMLSYIHENYMHEICLEQLAKLANVSVGECCRCFQQLVGMSPNQYLLNYRISRGAELLAATELSVTEVAFRVGFNDSSHFIQSFRKREGVTPGKFRQERIEKC